MKLRPFMVGSLLFAFAVVTGAADGDWPMWRGDAGRTGASANPLSDQLSLLWHSNPGRPNPAFIHQMRMCADAAYAPVAADGLVFLPSNLRDEVVALDLATGAIVWRHITGGPVRYAPAVSVGKLFFGSDDGSVYCLNAATGELVWRIRGVPDHLPNSKLLINGRLCSRWAVRGGPVVHQGTLFFGAGVWPEEGVYVSAVTAETGKLLWRTDALSLRKAGMNDHNRVYDLGLPPQGYLAIINGKLAVPSGRTLAAFLDPATGEVEPYNCYYSKHNQPRGTWWLCGDSTYWIQGGCVFSTTPINTDDLPPEEMDLDTFSAYVGKSPTETLALLKRFSGPKAKGKRRRVFSGLNRVEIVEKGGKTIIKAALRSQNACGAFTPVRPEANELYNYANRPLLNADAYRLHNEGSSGNCVREWLSEWTGRAMLVLTTRSTWRMRPCPLVVHCTTASAWV
ncbi:MAG: PQQ-binding-like beta-propeller repeat protein, partial [Lentisphaerae bacterium]|nr:PQQ-binding-like beta-propeller repeat protein [Lentisphaerota bacterium]MBT7844804.1 PQQ-binding-like beta-propeller repeat protein [Lentisphaerota bacterium]